MTADDTGDGAQSAPPPPSVPLTAAVVEIERHVGHDGWDQPPRLYALVDTADLLSREPALAKELGVSTAAPDSLTPVEQEALGPGLQLDDFLAGIAWPQEVVGCALAHEVLALPESVEAERPDDADVAAWANAHPSRREMRMVVGVLRDGSRLCILRVRSTDGSDDELLTGTDLVPGLADALLATLAG